MSCDPIFVVRRCENRWNILKNCGSIWR